MEEQVSFNDSLSQTDMIHQTSTCHPDYAGFDVWCEDRREGDCYTGDAGNKMSLRFPRAVVVIASEKRISEKDANLLLLASSVESPIECSDTYFWVEPRK